MQLLPASWSLWGQRCFLRPSQQLWGREHHCVSRRICKNITAASARAEGLSVCSSQLGLRNNHHSLGAQTADTDPSQFWRREAGRGSGSGEHALLGLRTATVSTRSSL